MKRPLNQKFLVTLLVVCLSSCTHTISNNVKLENFPPIRNVGDLNVYWYFFDGDHVTKRDKYGFKPLVWKEVEKYKYPTPEQIKVQKQSLLPKSGCVLDVEYTGKLGFQTDGIFGNIYGFTSFVSLYLIPYYQPYTKKLNADLIDAKTGNILKEYHYEESVDYWVTSNPIFILYTLTKKSAFDGAQAVFNVESKLNKALAAEVTNDAYNIPECQKK